jgi:hypothetical protein
LRETGINDGSKNARVKAPDVIGMNLQNKLEKYLRDFESSRAKKRSKRLEEGANPKQVAPEQPDYDLVELRDNIDQLVEAAAGRVELYEQYLEYVYNDRDEDEDEEEDPFAHHVGIKLVACNYDITYNHENGEPIGKPAYYWRIAAYRREWLLLEHNYETEKSKGLRYKRKGNLLNHLLRRLAPLICD